MILIQLIAKTVLSGYQKDLDIFFLTSWMHKLDLLYVSTSFPLLAAAPGHFSVSSLLERRSVQNFPAISSSVWAVNELALNLALTPNQEKVIKYNTRCAACEKWQRLTEAVDVDFGDSAPVKCLP